MSILGIVGRKGHGKTMNGVRVACDMAVLDGLLLCSNIAIIPPAGVEFEQIDMGEGWPERLARLAYAVAEGYAVRRDGTRYHGLVFFLDEAGLMLNAREWKSFPSVLVWLFSQCRKFKAEMIWTAQWVEMVDAVLRGMTDEVWTVAAWPGPTEGKRRRGKRPWLYRVKKWRPSHVEQKDACLGTYWFRYHREWEGLYDTDAVVWPPSLSAFFSGLPKGQALAESDEQAALPLPV
jgi:hypothetical protein